MSAAIRLRNTSGSRLLETSDLPITVGGPQADIPVPGVEAAEPLAAIGLDAGQLFVQPTGAASGQVACNGAPIATSQWLRDGDSLSAGGTHIQVERDGAELTLAVERIAAVNMTEPPLVGAPAAATATAATAAGSESRIKPMVFAPRSAAAPAARRSRLRLGLLLPALLVAALAASAWFLFTARSVEILVEPAPDRATLVGGLLRPRYQERYLLRPGSYQLTAGKAGYRELSAELEVTRDARQSHRYQLTRLPGLLALTTIAGASVEIDGNAVGETPLGAIELEEGEHQVVIRADRYQDYAGSIVIEGGGVEQSLSAELVPAWAAVTIDSVPPGAAVAVDGEALGITPLMADVMAGKHTLQLTLAGHQPRSSRFEVTANQPLTLPAVRLDRAAGRLVVRSRPAAAAVSVDGRFRGQTPLELAVAPDGEHEVRLAKSGWQPTTVTVRVASAAQETVDVELSPSLGEVEFQTTPAGAELLIDGEARGAANQTLQLTTVAHEVEIRKDGYEAHRATVTPRPGLTQSLVVTLERAAGAPVPGATAPAAAAQAAALPARYQTKRGQEMVLVKAPARFQMGASRREPGRRANESIRHVELTRSFYISAHEVTNEQFHAFMGHSSGSVSGHGLDGDDRPVVRVTWEQAARYCNWLSKQEGLPPAYVLRGSVYVGASPLTGGYRLPTEAEWTYAARYAGGSARKYPWGEKLPVADGSGNFADQSARNSLTSLITGYDDGYPVTAPVGKFPANPIGLFDIGGNVSEWIHDHYTIYPSAQGTTDRDPVGPDEGEFHVARGSSWRDSTVTELRLSYRDYGAKPRADLGFRIARYAQ